MREILAQLGYRSLIEIIGRTDLLKQVSRGARYLDDLDLNPLLTQADGGREAAHCTVEGRNEVPDTLDAQMIRDAAAAVHAPARRCSCSTACGTPIAPSARGSPP